MNRKLTTVLASLVLGALGTAPLTIRAEDGVAPGDGAYEYSRPMSVTGEGWVLADLPPVARSRMTDEHDFAIVSPSGTGMSGWLVDAGSSSIITGTPETELPIVDLDTTTISKAPGSASLLVTSPGPGVEMRTLMLAWPDAAATAVRLSQVIEGRWTTVADGEVSPDDDGTARAELEIEAMANGSDLLLDLVSAGATTPMPFRAAARVEPAWILFEAPGPGSYLLAYRATKPTDGAPAWNRPPVGLDQVERIVPGREREHELGDLPLHVVEPAAELDVSGFANRWNVTVDEPADQSLVELVLPADIHRDRGAGRGPTVPDDLRIECLGRQVPYIGFASAEPRLLYFDADAVPAREPGSNTSVLSVDLPAEDLPLAQLELVSGAAPFNRRVTVAIRLPAARPGVQPRRTVDVLFDDVWTCPEGRAACWLSVSLRPNITTDLEITFHDGDNAPLASMQLRIWRGAQAVRFVWPGAPVTLLSGNPDLGRPEYDLLVLAPEIELRPAHEAHAAPIPAQGVDPRIGQALLVAALVAAGTVLLAVLSRGMRH